MTTNNFDPSWSKEGGGGGGGGGQADPPKSFPQ